MAENHDTRTHAPEKPTSPEKNVLNALRIGSLHC